MSDFTVSRLDPFSRISADYWADDMELEISISDYVIATVTGLEQQHLSQAMTLVLGEVGRNIEVTRHHAEGSTGS